MNTAPPATMPAIKAPIQENSTASIISLIIVPSSTVPHCRYPNSTGWQKSVGRMGASAEVLDFFRAWHSRNIQQARTRLSNGSLEGGNECEQSGNLDSSKRDEDLLDSMRASRCT